MNTFVVIDFETANSKRSSICQIGIVKFENSIPAGTFTTYVNPEEEFNEINTFVHGITEDVVRDAPKFPEIYPDIINFLGSHIVLSHSLFDMQCMQKVTEKYGLYGIDNVWLDAIEVIKRTIPEYGEGSYKLQHLAKHFSIQTKAHDALDDAYTCALILNKVLAESNTQIDEWVNLIKKPVTLTPEKHPTISYASTPNPLGEYFGRSVVFTGSLSLITREEATELAHAIGLAVDSSVKKKSNYLVVGIQDPIAIKGKGKSTKEIKAEQMIANGADLKILDESEFMKMCGWVQ